MWMKLKYIYIYKSKKLKSKNPIIMSFSIHFKYYIIEKLTKVSINLFKCTYAN